MPYDRSPLQPSQFKKCLEAAKAGEEWAWEQIYTTLAGPVTGYLRTRGAYDPEDLSSEVFFQAARGIHRFDGDESRFRSWIFVIAHRRLIDSRRARSRQVETVDETPEEHDIQGGDVEEEVLEQLAVAGVRDIFGQLTEDQSQVLALRIIADLTLEETARVMGKRTGAIKALQRRALRSIRVQIERGRVSL